MSTSVVVGRGFIHLGQARTPGGSATVSEDREVSLYPHLYIYLIHTIVTALTQKTRFSPESPVKRIVELVS